MADDEGRYRDGVGKTAGCLDVGVDRISGPHLGHLVAALRDQDGAAAYVPGVEVVDG